MGCTPLGIVDLFIISYRNFTCVRDPAIYWIEIGTTFRYVPRCNCFIPRRGPENIRLGYLNHTPNVSRCIKKDDTMEKTRLLHYTRFLQ